MSAQRAHTLRSLEKTTGRASESAARRDVEERDSTMRYGRAASVQSSCWTCAGLFPERARSGERLARSSRTVVLSPVLDHLLFAVDALRQVQIVLLADEPNIVGTAVTA